MKSWLFLLVVSVSLYPTYESNGSYTDDPPTVITGQPDTIDFKDHIQPILVTRCSPCHFTGGKMYAKMPFDKAATILEPEAKNGILKRIKDEQEKEMIKRFMEKETVD
jgi:hypothetical protein